MDYLPLSLVEMEFSALRALSLQGFSQCVPEALVADGAAYSFRVSLAIVMLFVTIGFTQSLTVANVLGLALK
jgi:hypothetical protein